MDIGINNPGNIFKEVIRYDADPIIQNTSRSITFTKNTNDNEQVNFLEISDDSIFSYALANRFRNASLNKLDVKFSNKYLLDSNNYDDSFIKDFSIEYYKIKQEMSSNYSKDELKERMNLVDKVYEDVVNQAAESLSTVFENFFDYSSNITKVFKMKSTESIFDKERFKNHLSSMATKALNTVKNTDADIPIDSLNKDIEKTLQTVNGNDLSTMSYKDIKILSNLFKTLPSLHISLTGNIDKNIVDKKAKIWSKALENLDNNLSKNVKEAVIKSGNRNIKTFYKIGNYIDMKDNFKNELEKLNKLLSKLIDQRKRIEKRLDIQSKQLKLKEESILKIKLRFMEQIQNLDNNINMLTEKIANIQKNLDSLANNPDEIDSYLANEEAIQK